MIYLLIFALAVFLTPLTLAACQCIGFKKYSKDYENEVNKLL